MEMCYDGALVMPNNYAVVEEEEMTYIDGGIDPHEWAVGIVCGLIANAITAIVSKVVTVAMVKAAISAVGAAANAIWGAITSAAAFIWNTPVAMGILCGVVGIGIGIVIDHYCL